MVKKIEWTYASVRDRVDIYRYWEDRNKSDFYSEKLELLFNEAANLIAQFPHAGTETNVPNLRIKVVKQFRIYYLNQKDVVQIIRVWDTRRNPESFSLS